MLTMSSALDRARRFYAGHKAIVDYEGTWTWREHTDRVAKAAGLLRKLGVKRGGRFGVLSRNTFRHCELIHAGYWMGAVPVPVNIRLAPPEIAYILDNAGVKTIAVEDVFLELLDRKELARWKKTAFCVSPEPGDGDLPHYETLLAEAEPAPLHGSAEDDDAILLYTGGTTGRSKGVPLSHLNVVSNGMQCGHTMGFGSAHTYLHVAPMFHSADLLGTGFTLMGGAHVYLPMFTPELLLKAIQDLRVSHTMLAPTMIIMTLQDQDVGAYDLSSLRWFLYGSAPMAAEWIVKTIEAFKGVSIEQGYGLTETSPLTHANPIAQAKAGSIGIPLPDTDARILDMENGRALGPGQPGEIDVKGPQVMKGYWKRPRETAAAIRDGWLHTGDVGFMDEQGYFTVVDRLKDVINTAGYKVWPREVEEVIYKHPAVKLAAVVGVEDDYRGEIVKAFVVPKDGRDGEVTREEIIALCKENLAAYKAPRAVEFRSELPVSGVGKMLRRVLREESGGG